MDGLDSSRYQRDLADLQAARGVAMNKGIILLFLIVALVSVVGLLVVGVSGLAGWILVAVIVGIGVGGTVSGKMDVLMTLGVALLGAITGVMALIATTYVLLGLH